MPAPWPFTPGDLEGVSRQLGELSRRLSDRTATFPVNVAGVLAVAGASVWRTANTAATNVTGFSGGYDTMRLVVIAGDANTTLVHSAALRMKGSANVTLGVNGTRQFIGSADPATRAINWLEV